MKKILYALASVGAVAGIAIAASGAFFSDTETSTGNTFEAGSIDLQVGAQINPNVNTAVHNVEIQNLNNQVLFTYTDLKPGDMGDGNYTIQATSNDYWACIRTTNVATAENAVVDAETDAGDPGIPDGELQKYMTFAFWNDVNGNGVYDSGTDTNLVGPWLEGTLPFIPVGLYTMPGLQAAGWIPLADTSLASFFGSTALTPTTQYHLGFKYCFGVIQPDLSCPVGGDQNDAQTDGISGDLQFYAVQSRNNSSFTCASLNQQNIRAADLAVDGTDAHANPTKWFLYNDSNDTFQVPPFGVFVAGPATPLYGTGSVEFTLAGSPNDRKNIATYQFAGKTLASIGQMSMGVYSHGGSGGAGANESPFFNFNVDFDGSNVWQSRLVYVPSVNGPVSQDSWNTFDMINGGAAQWTWSRYAKGPDNTASTLDDNTWPGGNTNQYRTWSDIVSSYPGIRVLPSDPWLGIRVGEPGPTGYIGNVDFFSMNSTVYNFDN